MHRDAPYTLGSRNGPADAPASIGSANERRARNSSSESASSLASGFSAHSGRTANRSSGAASASNYHSLRPCSHMHRRSEDKADKEAEELRSTLGGAGDNAPASDPNADISRSIPDGVEERRQDRATDEMDWIAPTLKAVREMELVLSNIRHQLELRIRRIEINAYNIDQRRANQDRRKQLKFSCDFDLLYLINATTGAFINGFPKTFRGLLQMELFQLEPLADALGITVTDFIDRTEKYCKLRTLLIDKICGPEVVDS